MVGRGACSVNYSPFSKQLVDFQSVQALDFRSSEIIIVPSRKPNLAEFRTTQSVSRGARTRPTLG